MPENNPEKHEHNFGDWVNDNGAIIGFIISVVFAACFLWNAGGDILRMIANLFC